MADALADWANPSSVHAEGRAARARLDACRRGIAATLGWSGPLVFTSGATEGLDIALRRVPCDRIIVSAVEHPAVHRAAPGALLIPVDREGRLDLDALGGLLAGSERPLICVQAVNNEAGMMLPVNDVARLVRNAGGLLLVDCAQSAGKIPLPEADMVVVASHKLGGPPGAGALLLRHAGLVEAIGGQEDGVRPGTHNLPAIAGFAAAIEAHGDWFAAMLALRQELERRIEDKGGVVVAGGTDRIATIGAYRMPGVPAAAQLMHMDLAGIAVSVGSACSSGAVRPRRTLRAMGWEDAEAAEVVRISFGRGTSRADVVACADAWSALAVRKQAAEQARVLPLRSIGGLAAQA